MSSPFDASGSVNTTDRMDCVRKMDKEALKQALATTHNLQATVERSIKSRLRRLEKEVPRD
jgi:hypothetical protein